MKTITQEQLLMEHIEHLQKKQDLELLELRSQVHNFTQSLNPLTLLKSFLFPNEENSSGLSTDFKSDLINTVVNVTSKFLSRNSVLSQFQNPIKKILGNILQRFVK
ncbi:hypothetical protein [Flavobacterium sp. 102]|uniref:hypothetical protein n=1 Tax=Flavobacterium sp. 102 TaxID=2135623 RepID=UPI000EB4ACD8|nr:hypothetical protein [Flavobacterium sp. 102]RKS02765.1 hypothetical protein C8C84_2494 [Flavobacterium sp. 102]